VRYLYPSALYHTVLALHLPLGILVWRGVCSERLGHRDAVEQSGRANQAAQGTEKNCSRVSGCHFLDVSGRMGIVLRRKPTSGRARTGDRVMHTGENAQPQRCVGVVSSSMSTM
jgi:hypothetical protein